MKVTRKINAVLTFVFLLVSSMGASAQAGYATVSGKCIDENGQPITEAVVQMRGTENGQKYDIKTDKKGTYFSIGIQSGIYNVALVKNGVELYHRNNFQVRLSEENNKLDFDLAKEKKESPKSVVSEAERKAHEAAVEEAKKSNNMNDILAKASDAVTAGDTDTAIKLYKQAAEIKPDENYIFGKMGDVYLGSAKKATDADDRSQKYQSAADSYKKAIELALASVKEKDKINLGPYYNNLGEAYAKNSKFTEAVESYNKAAASAATSVKPSDAGMYYFNLGAVMTNAGHSDEAVAAFDKCIAADPTRADAYYWKGVALAGKAGLDKEGKVVPLPGTIEAFNKYLELKPAGPMAAGAKDMLTYLGSSIQTKVNTKKK